MKGMNNMKNLKVYKKCLIVVDMVNGFVKEGVLHDEEIMNAVPRQIELLEEYKKEEELVIFIRDVHHKNSIEFKRFGDTTHCLEDTHEAEIIDELLPYTKEDNSLIFTKNCTSYMMIPELKNILVEANNIKIYDVVGCCTDICIVNGVLPMMNFFDQLDREVEVRVHEDGIETYHSPLHDREQYSNAAYLLLEQQGAKKVRKKGEMKYGK